MFTVGPTGKIKNKKAFWRARTWTVIDTLNVTEKCVNGKLMAISREPQIKIQYNAVSKTSRYQVQLNISCEE